MAGAAIPRRALLEVLDPAQNHTFRDHYLELDLDLSDVLFLATANVLDTIPGPLLDRMEIVQLDGYTEDEKVAIAKHHLFPRQREKAGLRDDELDVTDAAFHALGRGWTREAGVRGLERQLGKIARKAARKVADGEATTGRRRRARPEGVRRPAALPCTRTRRVHRSPVSRPGLAVTGAGGDVLTIEVTGDGRRARPAGDRSARRRDVGVGADRAVVRACERGRARRAPRMRSSTGKFHLHVPSGAVPKDGPSAGITMTTALASLVTGRPVKPDVGMTGEVTLQGRVLPIGGLKQKVLAAHRAGLTDVVIPIDNEPDLDDVPESVREQVHFHPVRDVREVLDIALT